MDIIENISVVEVRVTQSLDDCNNAQRRREEKVLLECTAHNCWDSEYSMKTREGFRRKEERISVVHQKLLKLYRQNDVTGCLCWDELEVLNFTSFYKSAWSVRSSSGHQGVVGAIVLVGSAEKNEEKKHLCFLETTYLSVCTMVL